MTGLRPYRPYRPVYPRRSYNRIHFVRTAGLLAWLCVAPYAFCEPVCRLQGEAREVVVGEVYDGDTVRLASGDKVRLIGVNTPELGKKGRAVEPLAEQARQHLLTLLPKNRRVLMQLGSTSKDRYGRTLAHLYLPDGRSVEAMLLAQGLGFHIAIPPNLRHINCLRGAETWARQQGVGVWAKDFYRAVAADQLKSQVSGFTGVTGVLDNISLKGKTWWLEFRGDVVLRVSAGDQQYFDSQQLRELLGVPLVVRGWLVNRSDSAQIKKRGFKLWVMALRHPSALQRLETTRINEQ